MPAALGDKVETSSFSTPLEVFKFALKNDLQLW
jgi:hypothetical protein